MVVVLASCMGGEVLNVLTSININIQSPKKFAQLDLLG